MTYFNSVKAVVLDFDGVMLDSAKKGIGSFQNYALKNGYRVTVLFKNFLRQGIAQRYPFSFFKKD